MKQIQILIPCTDPSFCAVIEPSEFMRRDLLQYRAIFIGASAAVGALSEDGVERLNDMRFRCWLPSFHSEGPEIDRDWVRLNAHEQRSDDDSTYIHTVLDMLVIDENGFRWSGVEKHGDQVFETARLPFAVLDEWLEALKAKKKPRGKR